VLHVADMVRLLWGLAVLQQYHHRLYRNVAFRASSLPDGVPTQPSLRRLLREATVLHSCEHRLDLVAATAAAAILPAWMSGQSGQGQAGEQQEQQGQEQQQQQQQQGQRQRQEQQGQEQQPGEQRGDGGEARQEHRQEREHGYDAAAPAAAAASAVTGLGGPPMPTQLELRADADAACDALRLGGLWPVLKQFSFGDYLILVEAAGGGDGSAGSGRRRRGPQVGVIPAGTAGRCAVNAPAQLLGSALVSQRVLSARGLPVVHATGDERELLALCRKLLKEGAS
jgi:hypothetical protein